MINMVNFHNKFSGIKNPHIIEVRDPQKLTGQQQNQRLLQLTLTTKSMLQWVRGRFCT